MNFLNITIQRTNNSFISNVYLKQTLPGLGISFFSICFKQFKLNSASTLIQKAYKICSSYKFLHSESQFFKSFFSKNGFPVPLVQTSTKKFLSSVYYPTTVSKPSDIYFITLPYFGHQSYELKSDFFSKLIEIYFRTLTVRK